MAYQNPINIYDQDFDWNGQAISNIYRQFLLAGGNEYLYTGDGNLRTDVVTRRFTTFDVTLPQTQGQGFLFEGTSFLPSPLAVGRVYQFDTHNLPYYSHPGNQWWLTFGIWNGTTPPTELTTETLHVGVPGQTGSCVLLTISENIYNTLKQNPTHKLIAYWGNWGARTQYYSPEIIIETGKPTTQANDLDFRGDLQPVDGSWLLKGNLNHGISHSMATTYGHAQGTSHLVEAEYSHVEGSGSTARSILPATNQNSSPITPDLRWLFVNNFGPNTDGRIAGPILTNPGSGYTTPFVQGTVAGGGGTGAQVFLNINTTTGQAEGVFIQAQGSGYSSPTVTFPTPQVGQTATATIVANQRSFILGNQQREDDLLQFCTDLNINALVLMDLGAINWNNPTPTGGVGTPTAGDMNAFLQKVKSTTEIQHVSFALEYDNLVTVDNRNYTPLIPIGQYNNYPSSGVNFRQADSFTWFLKYWPATDNPPAGYFYPNISDTIDLGIQAGVIPPGFGEKQNIYIPDVDSYLIYTSIQSTPSRALQRVFMEANTNVSVTDVTGTYEALRGSAFTGANAKSLPKFASALNRSFFNNTPFKPIVPVLSSNRITNPWNGNGGYNGSINTVVPAYRREYMGSFFQTGSIQQAYDNLTRLVNYTYILPNTKWSYETDSKTTSIISIGEVAVSNYFLLSASTTAQSRQAATDPPVPTITQGNSIANHIQGVSNQTQLSTNYTHVEGTRNIAANTLGTHMAGADNLSSGSMYSNIRGFSSSIIPQSTAAADHVEGGLNKVVGSLNYSHVHSYNSLVQGDAMHIHGERIIMSQSVFDRSVPETTALNTTITPSTASFATSHIAGYNNTLQIQPFIACTNAQIEATRATSIPDPAAPEYPVEIINYSCNFYFSKEYGDITSFVQSTFVNGLVSSSAALAILGLPLYAQGYNKPQEHSALSVDNIYTPTPYWPAYTASTWSSLADFVTTTYDGATGRTVLTINAREGQNPLGTWIPSTLATTVGSIPSPEKPITAFVQGEDVEEFYLSLIWKGPHIVSSSLYNTYSDIFNRQVATNTANHINASGSLTTLEAHNNNIHTGDGNGLTAFTQFNLICSVYPFSGSTVIISSCAVRFLSFNAGR